METTMKNTNQLIGCCGLNCEACDARIATITNDNTLREKTAALWTRLNGGNDHAGHDNLHRLPRRGRKNAVLRQALPRTYLRPGKETGYLRGLRADGRMPYAGAHRCKQPVRAGKSEAVKAAQA